jgi:hypothetical protein
MKIRLTTRTIRIAAFCAISLLVTANAAQGGEDTKNFIAGIFPEKVGPFTRVSVSRNETAIQGEVLDAASAKYVSDAGAIEWSGTQFASAEQAFAAVEKMMAEHQREDIGISSVKNPEGKVRYAVIEMPDGMICCWVNKQRKDLFFVVTGKMPEIETFMRAQMTW